MKFNKAYKFRLYPNTEQQMLINKTIGSARFIYNKMLSDKIEYYNENKEKLNNTPAQYKKEFEWLKEVDSLALANAQINLQTAYNNFFKNKSIGFPKFKSKHKSKKSYTTNNQKGSIALTENNKKIKLPKLGLVDIKCHRTIKKSELIKSCTISLTPSGKYYIGILVEYEQEIEKVKPIKVLGLDYSQPDFYVDSENRKPNFPKPKRSLQEKLSKEQRKLARKVKGSNNRNKQRIKVARLEEHIANQRRDFLHKLSNNLANEYDVICVEDIDLRAMSQCLSLGKNISDNGFGAFRTILEYKLKDRGKYFVKIDKWFPSSKLCNECGCVNPELKLGQMSWICPNCGELIDRDFNASKNIKEEGFRILSQELAC